MQCHLKFCKNAVIELVLYIRSYIWTCRSYSRWPKS